jgi:hypothetical protein
VLVAASHGLPALQRRRCREERRARRKGERSVWVGRHWLQGRSRNKIQTEKETGGSVHLLKRIRLVSWSTLTVFHTCRKLNPFVSLMQLTQGNLADLMEDSQMLNSISFHSNCEDR